MFLKGGEFKSHESLLITAWYERDRLGERGEGREEVREINEFDIRGNRSTP
jgi:hypothetical protein